MRAHPVVPSAALLAALSCALPQREPPVAPAATEAEPRLPLKASSASGLMFACQAEAKRLTQGEVYADAIVDAEAAAALAATLRANNVRDDAGFKRAVDLFYRDRGDDYDFLYLYVPDEGGNTYGLHLPVQAYSSPTLGMVSGGEPAVAAAHPRLRSVLLMKHLSDWGGGPALHELAHYWGNGLGLWPQLGFPTDRHWGETGVGGQLGGFRTDRLKCLEPADATPPACTRGPDGRYEVHMPPFGTYANGGDNVPYGPLELYLMGLMPADEVPPIAQLVDARRLNPDSHITEALYSVADVRFVTAAEISATTGGPPPERLDAARPLRVAFALVTPTPDPDGLARVTAQAREFSSIDLAPRYSWCTATGGRSVLRADL